MEDKFQAHPVAFMRAQAQAMGLPLLELHLDGEHGSTTPKTSPQHSDKKKHGDTASSSLYRNQYVACLHYLQQSKYQIQVIYTGDMDYVGTMTYNWMTECCNQCAKDSGLPLTCRLPLWQASRTVCLQDLWTNQFHVIYSCVKSPWFNASWIGRRLDPQALREMELINHQLQEQQQQQDSSNATATTTPTTTKLLDLGGENGEFHTMCLDGPMYQQALVFANNDSSKNNNTPVVTSKALYQCPGQAEQESWWVLDRDRLGLEPRDKY